MAFETMKRSASLESFCNQGLPKRARDGRDASQEPAWNLNTHRAFVEAVMKNGISQASPAVIRQEMTLETEAVTSERIKSKLQNQQDFLFKIGRE